MALLSMLMVVNNILTCKRIMCMDASRSPVVLRHYHWDTFVLSQILNTVNCRFRSCAMCCETVSDLKLGRKSRIFRLDVRAYHPNSEVDACREIFFGASLFQNFWLRPWMRTQIFQLKISKKFFGVFSQHEWKITRDQCVYNLYGASSLGIHLAEPARVVLLVSHVRDC